MQSMKNQTLFVSHSALLQLGKSINSYGPEKKCKTLNNIFWFCDI